MDKKRTLNVLLLLLLLAAIAAPASRAASEPRVLQRRLAPDGDRLTLYVRNDDGAAVVGVAANGAELDGTDIAPNPGETDLTTWILFDDSASMPEELRGAAADFISALVGERARNETYRFRTFSGRLRVEARDDGGVEDVRRLLEGLEYADAPSNVADALRTVASEVAARDGDEFVRILIVSANGSGVSARNAIETLSESGLSNIPVYVLDCGGGSSAFRTLAARTYARYWNIREAAASDVANILRWEEIPVRVSPDVPESRTESEWDIEVLFSDGSAARETVTFTPDVEAAPPEPDEASEAAEVVPEAETESETGRTGFPVGVAVLLIVLAGAGAAALVIRQKRGIAPARFARRKAAPSAYDAPPSGTDSDAAAVPDWGADEGGADDGFPTFRMIDLNRPERRFSASLRDRITVGRAPGNVISLDYDPTVSRSHCEIYLQDGETWIRDAGSTIGTYVGNARVKHAAKLPSGAVLRLGYALYRVDVR